MVYGGGPNVTVQNAPDSVGGRLDVEHCSATSIDRLWLTKAVQASLKLEFEPQPVYKVPYSSCYIDFEFPFLLHLR
jgi:hypothetical protein